MRLDPETLEAWVTQRIISRRAAPAVQTTDVLVDVARNYDQFGAFAGL